MHLDFKTVSNFRDASVHKMSSGKIFRSAKLSNLNLNERNKLINHGGITVNNALLPKAGTSQISFNYDSKGNLFGFYGYSLSNIFQLELLNIGSFNELNFK